MILRHLVFVINPKSGVDRQKTIQKAIETTLNREQFSYEIQFTQYAKHGTELAANAAAKGAYAVVAVGGDGSVNDVVKGLLGTNTLLAIIPKGSGNGMARTLGIPMKVEEAIHVINQQKMIAMDIGFVNGQPFISNAGAAFDALIAKKFARSTQRGLAIYSWLVTKHLWTYKEWDWEIEIDGKPIKERAFIINIANGRQFGYNFQIAPEASWTDGLLDVIIIRRFPKILGGMLVLRAMTGTITKSPFVRQFRGKEIIVRHPKLKLIQTDGDAHESASELRFTIQPGAQKVLVP